MIIKDKKLVIDTVKKVKYYETRLIGDDLINDLADEVIESPEISQINLPKSKGDKKFDWSNTIGLLISFISLTFQVVELKNRKPCNEQESKKNDLIDEIKGELLESKTINNFPKKYRKELEKCLDDIVKNIV